MDIENSPVALPPRCQRAVRGKMGLAVGASASGLGDCLEKRVCSIAHARDLAGLHAVRILEVR